MFLKQKFTVDNLESWINRALEDLKKEKEANEEKNKNIQVEIKTLENTHNANENKIRKSEALAKKLGGLFGEESNKSTE